MNTQIPGSTPTNLPLPPLTNQVPATHEPIKSQQVMVLRIEDWLALTRYVNERLMEGMNDANFNEKIAIVQHYQDLTRTAWNDWTTV